MKVTDIVIVPHVHWDREWYFTAEESQVLAERDFTEMLDYLEAHPEYPSYALDQMDCPAKLAQVAAEFVDAADGRVHRSIWSTRMDLKVRNTHLENRLTRAAEPISCIASELGRTYPSHLLELAWKRLMQNHAHDSMGGCNSDIVNREIGSRYDEVESRVEQLVGYTERAIAEGADLPGKNRFVAFNFLPTKVERLVTADVLTSTGSFRVVDALGAVVPFDVVSAHEVDPGLIDRQIVAAGHYDPFVSTRIQFRRTLPSMGYEAFEVREQPTAEKCGEPAAVPEKTANTIPALWGSISLRENGTIDLETKNGTTYRDLLGLEVMANAGDEYDFSPLPGAARILSAQRVVAERHLSVHAMSAQVTISYELEVPRDLAAWALDAGGITSVPTSRIGVTLHLDVDRESPVIGIRVELDNAASDCRVRLLVPTGLLTSTTTSDTQFGLIDRPDVDPAEAYWQREEWGERPDAIYPFLTFVAKSDASRTVAVATKSTREYQVENGTIEVTLLSCVGSLGVSDLERRPGRPSGINAPTPDAQCHGHIALDLGLAVVDLPLSAANPAQLAATWLTPVETFVRFESMPIQLSDPTITVPARYGLFEQTNDQLVLSCVKRAEAGGSLLARFYNVSDEPQRPIITGRAVEAWLSLDETERPAVTSVLPDQVVTAQLSAPLA